MLDIDKAILKLNSNAAIIASDNALRFKRKETTTLKYGRSQCAHYVKLALINGGLSSKNSGIESAKNYGPWLTENGFKAVSDSTTVRSGGAYNISGQQKGDVVIIQAAPGHQHGHIAMFNGSVWVSDFSQVNGFYPAKIYRDNNIPYILYRYSDGSAAADEPTSAKGNNKICYPVAKMRGQEFTRQEEILAHLEGESTGTYMIGRNGMWHGGIHITNATTPWCALSGNAASEKIDFPVTYEGEQAVRCMVDGEVVAYRICKDYMQIPWETGPLHCSGSFVLVKHYIQPGKKEKSGLHFYTLYMHLAPYSAYEMQQEDNLWTAQDKLAAYDPEWVMVAGSDNAAARNRYRQGTMPEGAIVEWDPADNNLHATAYNRRGYGLVTFRSLSEDAQKKGEKTTLIPGQRYWMLVDKKNIAPATAGAARPSWWKKLLPPAKEVMQLDRVVCPAPYAISAGDSVGHLGYFQVAKDGGYEPRYQVHIECVSMDDNLPEFLNNPEKVGGKSPLWLKYSPGLELYKKDAKTGSFSKDGRTTVRSGILALSGVSSEADGSSKQEYWQLAPENGYVPKGPGGADLLSQYDLAKLGFKTEVSEPASFDYLNGKTQPAGLLRSVFQSLYDAAKDDTRVSHALAPSNYQRLLNRIDSGAGEYSPMDYLRALHNPAYREVVQKTIVKHPSDWYHSKSDSIWQRFLDPLKKEAPEWKKYSEAFLDKMTWMQDVTKEKLGPSLWHMHPVMFLGMFKINGRFSYNYSLYNITIEDALDIQIKLGNNGGPTMQKGGGFPRITKDETRPYFDPTKNMTEPDIFQYLDISMQVNVSEEQMKKYLASKGILADQEKVFLKAAQMYGVNSIYLAVHASLETGNGTSPLGTGIIVDGVKVYNMYGIGALDGKAVTTGSKMAKKMGWTTPEKAIDGGASWIASHYIRAKQNTLYKMRWNPEKPGAHQYATAANWALAQSKTLKRECDHFPDVTLPLDIPVYKK
ncbi:N-acetylglucosaminidase [Erwinia sp. Eh17-17]|uniref:N-acetylglucosaminidase n=1 Tax=Erwinia sp. Eh17-17 TaxID=3080330 RepID=UPI003207C355